MQHLHTSPKRTRDIAPGAWPLDVAIERSTTALLDAQRGDGHWLFELEADASIPAEYILLLPRWSPFHISKISYWARTVLVPLLVLQALRPRARNPRGVRIGELFVRTRGPLLWKRKGDHQASPWFEMFALLDLVLRAFTPLLPSRLRRSA